MCFSLIQSGPFLSLPPSLHLDCRSSNPSAYKLDPLPLQIITTISKQPHNSILKPIHHPQSIIHTQSLLKLTWAFEHTSHIRSNRWSHSSSDHLHWESRSMAPILIRGWSFCLAYMLCLFHFVNVFMFVNVLCITKFIIYTCSFVR